MNDIFDKIYEEYERTTEIPCIELKVKDELPTIINSKIGGEPYLPMGYSYPIVGKAGNPYKMVAQLNFEELPHLNKFPLKGILQFYIDEASSESIVIYHEHIEENLETLKKTSPINFSYFPISAEKLLVGEEDTTPIPFSNARFDTEFMKVYKKYIVTDAQSINDIDDETYDNLCDGFYHASGHRIGGYAHFCQDSDVQSYNPEYDIQLLQLDIDTNITWGDSGTAHWFISSEALKSLNFTNVFFYWDCY